MYSWTGEPGVRLSRTVPERFARPKENGGVGTTAPTKVEWHSLALSAQTITPPSWSLLFDGYEKPESERGSRRLRGTRHRIGTI
jgi:hypothetical protein